MEDIPEHPGVYVLTFVKEKDMVKGSSDVLYIGKSHNLRKRVKRHFAKYCFSDRISRHTQKMDRRGKYVNVWYKFSLNASLLEYDLLDKFVEDHNQLPPWNLRMG